MTEYAHEQREFLESTWQWLHAHPELGFDTFETAAFVARQLRAFGYEVTEQVGVSGVLGVWDTGVSGPVFALRADMDALAFTVDGKTVNDHACGHDAHTAMLLTAAKILKEKSLIRKGKLVLVFQPAEEPSTGAAKMIETGLLGDVQEMTGIHIGDASVGVISPAIWSGGNGFLGVDFYGENAHASRPQLGVNATEIAAAAIAAVNCIRLDPAVPHSCKATSFSADGASFNTIPDHAKVYWDLRAQTNEVLDEMQQRMQRVIRAVAESLGARVEFEYFYSPAAQHDPDTVQMARELIIERVGQAAPETVTAGGEDFHCFARMLGVRTAFIRLGAAVSPAAHIYGMTFDHDAMLIGVDLHIACALRRLG